MTTKDYNIPKPVIPQTEPIPVGSPPPPLPEKDPEEDIIRQMYSQNIQFDNKPVSEIIRSVSEKSGINPSLLFSSALQEGMNLAINKPDEISEAYTNAINRQEVDPHTYPVDGFYNYGLDRFGDDYSRLKKYLPEGFETRFKTFKAKNEKGESITTAAFQNNEDALIAKSAVMKDIQQRLDDYAIKRKIKIEDADKDYFVLAAFNGGLGNAKTMLDQYSKAKNKRQFIERGETTRKGVHQNIIPRLQRMKLVSQILSEQQSAQ